MKFWNKFTGKDQINELLVSLHDARNVCDAMESERDRVAAELAKQHDAATKLSSVNLQLMESKTLIVKLNDRLDKEKGECESRIKQVQAREVIRTDELIEIKDEEIAGHKAVIDQHAARLFELNQELATVEAYYAAELQATASLRDQCEEHCKVIAEYLESLADRANEAYRLNEDAANKNTRIKELVSNTIIAEAKAAKHADINTKLEATIKDQEELLGKLEIERVTLSSRVAFLQTACDLHSANYECTCRKYAELEKGLFDRTPIENELKEQLDALQQEHDHCLKYGGDTIKMVLNHRNKLLSESEQVAKFKRDHGIK